MKATGDYIYPNPTFLKALEAYPINIEKFKRLLSHPNLNPSERKILNAHLCIRENNNDTIIQMLSSLKFAIPFLQAQQMLLLGLACNNKGNPKQAITFYKKSIKAYQKCGENNQIFFAIFNLLIAYENLGNFCEYKVYMKLLEKIPRTTSIMHIYYLRVVSSFFTYEKKYQKALLALDEAFDFTIGKENKAVAHYQSFLIIDKFILLFKLERYQECEELLSQYNKIRTFRSSSNYNFIKIMLSYFLHETPLYIDENDFKDAPLLAAQIHTIRSLSRFEYDEATKWWQALREINAEVYQDNFVFKQDGSLFAKCLTKCLEKSQLKGNFSKSKNGAFSLETFEGNIQEKLIYILKNKKSAISRIELIEMLWPKEPYSLKLENRLDALIYRTRKNLGLKIEKVNSHYKLAS